MIFTAEAFFGKTEDEIEAIPEMIVDIYKKGKTYIQDLATTAAPELAGRFVFGLRQKVEQSRPFSEEEIAGFTQLTKDFLQVHQAKIKADGDGTSVPSVVIACLS